MTGIVLAGGANKRMGKNKAFIEINGRRNVDIIIELFKKLFKEVIVVTNSPLEYLSLDTCIVTDLLPGKGSLGGIYTGLFYSSSFHSFVAACDMPFIQEKVVKYLMDRRDNFDVIIPSLKEGLQPLCCIYSKRCLTPILNLIKADNFKIIDLFPPVKVKEILQEEIQIFDPKLKSFSNINTPEDLKRAITPLSHGVKVELDGVLGGRKN